MLSKRQRRVRFRFSVRALLVLVALIGACLALIARPVIERRRFTSWIEQNGGSVERWFKPEPIVTELAGGLMITRSYQRILGPQNEPEIPRWRELLGDVPLNIVMLPVTSKESDVEAAKSLFP